MLQTGKTANCFQSAQHSVGFWVLHCTANKVVQLFDRPSVRLSGSIRLSSLCNHPQHDCYILLPVAATGAVIYCRLNAIPDMFRPLSAFHTLTHTQTPTLSVRRTACQFVRRPSVHVASKQQSSTCTSELLSSSHAPATPSTDSNRLAML